MPGSAATAVARAETAPEISVRTAETHRAHIMQKLSLSSRAELVRCALSEGLLEPDARTDGL